MISSLKAVRRATADARFHPAQAVALAFAAAIALFTVLLMLPAATASGEGAPFRVALFTSVSAVCVTGLTVVDTSEYWSAFGEWTILGGFQIGGLGIMTLASLLGLLVSSRLGMRSRLLAGAEAGFEFGSARRVLLSVAVVSFLIEFACTIVLAIRLWLSYDVGLGRAAYDGFFHAVSLFNNAGFVLWSDNFVRFGTDPWFLLPATATVLLGALGFPVLFELRRELRRPHDWSLHTKITLLTTGLFVVGGWLVISAFEWRNPATLGALPGTGDKMLAGFFQGVVPRTGGFASVDLADMEQSSWFVTDILMFVGGGSASTAGGIKVTTFMVLFFAIVAEARGHDEVSAFGRRISPAVIRQAIAVVLVSIALVASGVLGLLAMTDLDLDRVLFEVVSAFSTVGLTTGITAGLPSGAQYVLIVIMYAGRVGPATVASALALRYGRRLYRFPEERPIVG